MTSSDNVSNMANQNSYKYTSDGKFFILDSTALNAEEIIIPVALLDELIECGVPVEDLSHLLLARYESAQQEYPRVIRPELIREGWADKTVKNCHIEQQEYSPMRTLSPENRKSLTRLLDDLNQQIEKDKNRLSQRLLRLFLNQKK